MMKHIVFNQMYALTAPDRIRSITVISVHDSNLRSEPLIYESHKRWKEWKEAIDAAEKIMNER